MFNKTLSKTGLTANIDNMLYIPVDRKWENVHGQTKKGGSICCYVNINLKLLYKDFFFSFFLILYLHGMHRKFILVFM